MNAVSREFLRRMAREKLVQLVQPSREMKEAYLRRSISHLRPAKILLEQDQFEESVSMSYYSMYHSVMALFFATGIKCENHAAAILLLSDVFGIDNSDLSTAKRERIDKQYYASSSPIRTDATWLLRIAENFNAMLLDRMDRLTYERIEHLRSKFVALTK